MGMVSPETMAQYAAKSGEKNPTGVDIAPTTKQYAFQVGVTVPESYDQETVLLELTKLLTDQERAKIEVTSISQTGVVN